MQASEGEGEESSLLSSWLRFYCHFKSSISQQYVALSTLHIAELHTQPCHPLVTRNVLRPPWSAVESKSAARTQCALLLFYHIMPRHKPSPVAREDDFLSASDSSATDSDSDHGSERYTDARTASAVALPLSRQGTYKDDDGSLTASEDEKGAGRAASPRNNSFDLGSSDGESDEERLVGTGKRGASKSAKKKQKRSWVMRNVGDGTQQPGGGSSNTGIIVGILLVVLAIAIGGGVFLWKQGYLDSMTGSATSELKFSPCATSSLLTLRYRSSFFGSFLHVYGYRTDCRHCGWRVSPHDRRVPQY